MYIYAAECSAVIRKDETSLELEGIMIQWNKPERQKNARCPHLKMPSYKEQNKEIGLSNNNKPLAFDYKTEITKLHY